MAPFYLHILPPKRHQPIFLAVIRRVSNPPDRTEHLAVVRTTSLGS
jgi:hypothetical protein